MAQTTSCQNCKKRLALVVLVDAFLTFFTSGHIAQAQEANFVAGEVIVHFTPNVIDFPVNAGRKPVSEVSILNSDAQTLLEELLATEIERVFSAAAPNDTLKTNRLGEMIRVADASQIYKIMIPGDVLEAAGRLKSLPFVIFAEPNYIGKEDLAPANDALFAQGNQWGLHNTGQFGYTANVDVDAPEAWDITTGSNNVLIGILDSGIDYNHPDLGADFGAYPNQKVVEGYNYIDDNNDPLDLRPNSHGTAVSGIIGALTNNEDGSNDHKVAGVGGGWANSPYGFKLLPVKVTEPSNGSWEFDDLANGIVWAAQTKGAEVLNISIGTIVSNESSLLRFAITEAFNTGTVIVTSMGNENTGAVRWPAGYDHSVISVGAIDFNGNRIVPTANINWGSNTGSWIDVMAPGIDHWTTARLDSGGYREFFGTSAAAPFVTGFAGLILSIDPNASVEKVEAVIRASGKNYPTWSSAEGYNYIKMRKGLDLLNDPNAVEYNWKATGGSSTNDNFGISPGDGYVYQRYKVTKTVSFSQSFVDVPVIWGRRSGSTGIVKWPASTGQLNYNYTGIAPGTETKSSCQLVTYVYKKYNTIGQFIGWHPTSPGNVQFAYSVLGVPTPPPPPAPSNLTITNAGNLGQNVQLSWSASSGATSYKVYRCMTNSVQNCNYQQIGSTTSTSYTDMQVVIRSSGQSGDTFHYYVAAVNGNGESGPSNTVSTVGEQILFKQADVRETPVPETFTLLQNYPNPFNPETEIRYALPEAGQVELAILNVLGQPIRILVAEHQDKGWYRKVWDGRDSRENQLASGIYLYRIIVRQKDGQIVFTDVKKLSLVR